MFTPLAPIVTKLQPADTVPVPGDVFAEDIIDLGNRLVSDFGGLLAAACWVGAIVIFIVIVAKKPGFVSALVGLGISAAFLWVTVFEGYAVIAEKFGQTISG